MNRSVFRVEVLPFVWGLGLLLAATALSDALLHALKLVWIGRWLGIPGTLLIVASFAYSLRKRKLVSSGTPARLLELHEQFAWAGSLLVLVHAGIHLHAWLPWLATLAMLVNIVSGLVGRQLLQRSRKHVEVRRAALRDSGATPDEVEKALFWDAVAVDAMKQWRTVHFPITTAFCVLALAHVASTLLLWGWR
ncbi:MAG: hypothetical protein HZA61_13530 [Candidatus Eisenbacteria bacterium]|uniref:Iron reductase n=1 Tax=Eiseniibacteriota bacterium TaxID=2212470 RepID=A0A933W404_UNCEI|nr:hypothetical protein [Candidatus Eisenbacteria bacterium]